MVQLEPNEVSQIHSNKVKIGGVYYLSQKEYPCSSRKSCLEFSNGLCKIYSERPISCQEYPWYRFSDLLFYDSLCPGITDEPIGDRPDVYEILDSGRYFAYLPNLIRKPVVWLLTHL